ncbi:Outer membrane protein beta-barrel domain-containing protein [Aquimarina amphilecti]|uniref:Outer membrane protein beta-barrel domain-containing protein n=1 Tax=Aquimarina amphilecti TaxID=1038014 RepID=A0A1H7NFL6_AQUAM|nr:porin family protein [Aquimarina amphilecti]SEL22356.1 Outer membrane protein beta-barrel domain-containing protein [Aquimarina amphilecti]
MWKYVNQVKLLLVVVFALFAVSSGYAQEVNLINLQKEEVLDSLYREDQFYAGFTFNLLWNTPSGVSQSGFSGGLHLGYTRDMPINKKRNIAIGLGLGYSVNTYGQNLFIGEDLDSGQSIFSSLDGVDYDKNKFITHLVESPLEFRWRTSVPDTHKFWRIYTGLRIGYLYYFDAKFEQPGNQVRQTKIDELNRWRVGATFTFGWNTFNFHFYYSLNPLFNNNARIGNEEVGLTTAKIGLMFYIL